MSDRPASGLRRSLCALATTGAVVLAGCGVSDPYGPEKRATTTTAAAAPPPPVSAPTRRGLNDPVVRVAVDYATTQATWTASTWLAQRRHLRQLATAAQQRAIDAQVTAPPAEQVAALESSGEQSSARMLAVDVAARRPTGTVVVVVLKIRAQGSGRDAAATDYSVSEVTVTASPDGPRVSDFLVRP